MDIGEGPSELVEEVHSWLLKLLGQNYRNLRHLHLGIEMDLVTDYARQRWIDDGVVPCRCRTETIADVMREYLVGPRRANNSRLGLGFLSLTSLELEILAKRSLESVTSFNSLLTLELLACAGLTTALLMLTENTLGDLKLKAFVISHDGVNGSFKDALKAFLMALKPLNLLHVLLEGDPENAGILGKVMKHHGGTLRSLVWEERIQPRSRVNQRDHHSRKHLQIISKNCPNLTELGLCLNWEDLSSSNDHWHEAASYMSRFRNLKTLNIRNLPHATVPIDWLNISYM